MVTWGLAEPESANETIEIKLIRPAVERSIAITQGGLTAVGNDYRIPVDSYFLSLHLASQRCVYPDIEHDGARFSLL